MTGIDERTHSGSGLTGRRLLVSDIPVPDLPERYRDDRVVLLAKDPWTLFVYWDFDERTIASAMAGLDSPTVVLRLLEVGAGRSSLAREAQIDLVWNGYYVNDCAPGRTYRVELVFRGHAGVERRLGRPTHDVTLAPSGPSRVVDDRFVRWPDAASAVAGASVSHLHAEAFRLSGAGRLALSSPGSSDRGTVAALGAHADSSHQHARKGTP
jgi:hypothetical protein